MPDENQNERQIMTLQLKPIIQPGSPADLPTDAETLLSEEKIGPRDGAGKTVVVAMSGGVDSAVTALIMRERGYRVIGMNLRLFSPDDPERYRDLINGLYNSDWFMVAADFDAYAETQREVDKVWRNSPDWYARAIRNVARMGWFSSDRTIRQYASEIWNVAT